MVRAGEERGEDDDEKDSFFSFSSLYLYKRQESDAEHTASNAE